MARTLTTAMGTAVAAESGYSDVWLLVLTSSGGTLRFTSAPEDQVWDSNTYTAIGGMQFQDSSETEDLESQRLGISLAGVDQTVIAVLLGHHYRGHACSVYFGQIQQSTGLVVDAPMEVFSGLLNDPWSVKEVMPEHGPGTVSINTSAVGEASVYGQHVAVRTNIMSHNAMLDRAGLSVGDNFFDKVPGITGVDVKWGGGKRKAKPRIVPPVQ